jgi:hypothetical protein
MSAATIMISMNVKMTRSTILVVVVLATAISSPIYFATTPAFAQPTTGTPSPSGPGGGTTTGDGGGTTTGDGGGTTTGDGGGTTTGDGGGDFDEFMQCLNAAGPSPAEEDVTACYDPIYGSGAGDEEAAEGDGGDTGGDDADTGGDDADTGGDDADTG